MLNIFLRARVFVAHRLRLAPIHRMLLWAMVVGFLGALAVIAFRESIHGLQWLLVGHSGSLVEMARALPWQVRLALPALGGVAAGAVLVAARRLTTSSSSDYMEAIAIGDGRIPVRSSLLRCVSSLLSIVSGGSIGREGSMVQLAATSASVIGRIAHFDPAQLRLLVACAAAAGITSAYNAPIAGALFVTEIVLGSFAMKNLGPIVVASVVANITMREFPGYHPAYEMPPFPAIVGPEAALFIGLGILAGLLAPLYLRMLDRSKQSFKATGWPLPVRLGVGGAIVGLCSIWVPDVWGNGYSVVNAMLHNPWTWSAVLLVLLFKIIATAATTGSGAVGGIFTPTLFIGAALGTLFGQGMLLLFPGVTTIVFTYTIVGMGAFLAATTGAPLMAILMIFEMTMSYQVMLPLMLSCVVAYFVAGLIDERSMYEVTVKRHRDAHARVRLRNTPMRALLKPVETVLNIEASFGDVTRMFVRYPVKYLYVVDRARRFLGVVALQDVTSVLADDNGSRIRTIAALLREDFHVLSADMAIGDALAMFLAHQGERLPVVESRGNPVLLGVVYKSLILDTYVRLSTTDHPVQAPHL
jgi:CIC family chloride channel protein